MLLQSFNDPNAIGVDAVAHRAIAEGSQCLRVSGTVIGGRRLLQAWKFGNYYALLKSMLVCFGGVVACNIASTERRGRSRCELGEQYSERGVGRYRLPIGGQRDVPEQEWLRTLSRLASDQPIDRCALSQAGHAD